MADAKKTTVNVTYSGIDPVTGKAIFTIKPTGPNSLPTGPDGLIFVNDHFPGFQISFVLIDDTHQNFAFPPNSSKDMAVSSVMGANQCPPQKTSDVFQIVGVSGTNNNTLTVLNANKDKLVGIFSYVLWITNDGGKSYVPLDPGGVNQNGPSTKFPLTSVVIFAVAVAVLALVALYWLGVFNR